MSSQTIYDLKSVKLPYLSGGVLKLFIKLMKMPIVGNLLLGNLLQSAGINDFRKMHFSEAPTLKPIHYIEGEPANIEAGEVRFSEPPEPVSPGFRHWGASDFVKAYQTGALSPETIAQRVIEAMEDSNHREPPLRAMIAYDPEDILHQARASAERYQNGNPLSLLDGVPVAVKDEVDMLPYTTTAGTAFLGTEPAASDSTVVARLRQKGALLIGKANMHEIGINVTGLNPHHGLVRNPYSNQHYSGGSSSGSGSAVASGLCPVAIGADGGGSIRIPASFCGVVGIKSTYGRVSEHGATPLCWSVAHIGPLAANLRDAVLAWSIISGPDPNDPTTLHQPAPALDGWTNLDFSDLRLGIFWDWFRHAETEVVAACEGMLDNFQTMGAKVVPIEIPDMEAGRVAHTITIASEMAQALDKYDEEHGHKHGMDIQINLALARTLSSQDYIHAQRVRTRMMEHFLRVFEEVDVIITPATGITAPEIKPNALPEGDSDVTILLEIMRYSQPANLTGLPAIAFPVGYSHAGLPIGMQVIGRPWDERTLFRMGLGAEQFVVPRKPAWHYSLLED